MIRILGTFLALLPCSALAADVSAIVGTWNVQSTQTRTSTCNSSTAGSITSYIWIVSANVDGTVRVSVQGETQTPVLNGSIAGDRVVLWGPGDVVRYTVIAPTAFMDVQKAAYFDLRLADDGAWRGTRRYMSFENFTGRDGVARLTPCFIDFEVVAKKG